MKNKNFILTGSTGILGSHILYELMHAIHSNNYEGKLVLLLRSKKDKDCAARLDELFNEDMIPHYLKEVDTDRIRRNHVTLVDFDLRYINEQDLVEHLTEPSYHLIHCAASVNLGTNAYAFEEIRHNNYLGTLNLIHILHERLAKVSYVSTAFSLSNKNGDIHDSTFHRSDDDYRNHYERYKVQTEQEVAQICDAYNLPLQIFRPSIICGRLVDYPYHVIPKFLVFYMFGAFFYRAKATYGDQPVRIAMNSTSGMNMIPVDYAAKAIVRALDTDIKELNLVSRKNLSNKVTIPVMMRLIGWSNYEFMEHVPNNQSMLEKLYYKTVGAQLNNYMETPGLPEAEFNTSALNELMKDIGEPSIESHFSELCAYAVGRGFASPLEA